jgi:MFS superfamily sulfate permease-like transporter
MLMAGALADQVLHKYGQVEEKYDVDDQSFSPSSALDAGGVLLGTDKNKEDGYTATQAVTMVTLAVGLWQVGMSILRLGAFSVLLSDVLVSGFTTGSSIHVVTSQLKNVFGLAVPKENRFPKLLRVWAYSDNRLNYF